jgi:hypothetical protein
VSLTTFRGIRGGGFVEYVEGHFKLRVSSETARLTFEIRTVDDDKPVGVVTVDHELKSALVDAIERIARST